MTENLACGALPFRRRHRRGVACALGGAALWGFSGACAQFLLAGYGVAPTLLTAVRMLGAGVLFLLVLLVRSRSQLAAMLCDHGTVVRLSLIHI